MENNKIINNLIGNGEIENKNNDSDNEGVSTIRVISIRYKIYAIILFFLVIIGLLNYFLPNLDNLKEVKNNYNNIVNDVNNFSNKKSEYEKTTNLINKIEQNENQVLDCLNKQIGCSQIDDTIKNNFTTTISYIQANSLYNPKMPIDEKIILRSINEYLLKDDNGNTNGELNKISIGDQTQFKNNLYFVPINLSIKFQNRDSLMSFINNIEKKINPEKDMRILYKIDQISYNIMDYQSEQNVDIYLKAYYYKSK